MEPADKDEQDAVLDELRVVLDLKHLAELVVRVTDKTRDMAGLEPYEAEGQELKDIFLDAWRCIMHMSERDDFKRAIEADLAKLTENEPLQ